MRSVRLESDFCFTPESRLNSAIAECLKCAPEDSCIAINAALFDHLVGAEKKRLGNFQTQCLGRLQIDE